MFWAFFSVRKFTKLRSVQEVRSASILHRVEVKARLVVVRYGDLRTLKSFKVVEDQMLDFNLGAVDMISLGKALDESPLIFCQETPKILLILGVWALSHHKLVLWL